MAKKCKCTGKKKCKSYMAKLRAMIGKKKSMMNKYKYRKSKMIDPALTMPNAKMMNY